MRTNMHLIFVCVKWEECIKKVGFLLLLLLFRNFTKRNTKLAN